MTNEEWLENLNINTALELLDATFYHIDDNPSELNLTHIAEVTWKKLLRFLHEWDKLKASEQLDCILDLLKKSYEEKSLEKAASCLIPLAIVRNRVVKLEDIVEEKKDVRDRR